MRYVVQNFNQYSKLTTVTPRIKDQIFYHSVYRVFFFLRLNALLLLRSYLPILIGVSPSLLYYYFYTSHFSKQITSLNSSTHSYLTTNLQKSYVFHSLCALSRVLNQKRFSFIYPFYATLFLYNQNFLGVKGADIRVNNNYYKSNFFFWLLFTSHLWFNHSFGFSYYLNFLVLADTTSLFKFYNGYFLPIYTF